MGVNSPLPPPGREGRKYYRPQGLWARPRGTPPRSQRGKSWHPEPHRPQERECWLSAGSWLTDLRLALLSTVGKTVRARFGGRVETVLDVAAVDAASAEARTGRGVSTAHETVAARLGCSRRTVQRARRIMEELGFVRLIEVGRHLTREERAAAREYHGRHQVNIASERALVQPRREPVEVGCQLRFVTLPRRGLVTRRSSASRSRPTRAGAHAARPSIEVQRLAADLARKFPDLGDGHIGRLCVALERLGIDSEGWDAQDVAEAITRLNQDRGWFEPRRPRNPLGLLVHQMRLILRDLAEAPKVTQARRRAQQRAEREAREMVRAAERVERAVLRTPERQSQIGAVIAEGRRRLKQALWDRPQKTGVEAPRCGWAS